MLRVVLVWCVLAMGMGVAAAEKPKATVAEVVPAGDDAAAAARELTEALRERLRGSRKYVATADEAQAKLVITGKLRKIGTEYEISMSPGATTLVAVLAFDAPKLARTLLPAATGEPALWELALVVNGSQTGRVTIDGDDVAEYKDGKATLLVPEGKHGLRVLPYEHHHGTAEEALTITRDTRRELTIGRPPSH